MTLTQFSVTIGQDAYWMMVLTPEISLRGEKSASGMLLSSSGLITSEVALFIISNINATRGPKWGIIFIPIRTIQSSPSKQLVCRSRIQNVPMLSRSNRYTGDWLKSCHFPGRNPLAYPINTASVISFTFFILAVTPLETFNVQIKVFTLPVM